MIAASDALVRKLEFEISIWIAFSMMIAYLNKLPMFAAETFKRRNLTIRGSL
jgi:hypothetical protein